MLADDADYVRIMKFVWDLLDERDVREAAEEKWLE